MQLTMERTRSQRPLLTIATVALLLVALIATALFIGAQQRQLPSPFRNGAVVFEQDGDLFIADQLDGPPRPLVAGPEEDSDPVFSDQGDRVAFVRDASDGKRIMTVRSDGTGITLLASGLHSFEVRLGWAPDGRALLASGEGRSDRGFYEIGPRSRVLDLMASDGSGSRRVDAGPDFDVGPGAWRPDGRHIAFLAIQEEGRFAFIADADGTNVRRLPIGVVEPDGGLAWSPDGTQLSFTSRGQGEDIVQVNVADIDVDGVMMGLRQLPPDERMSADSTPTWSPDGSYFALLLQGPQRVGIFEPDGSGYRIVEPATYDRLISGVAWSPDGRSLVITGDVLQEDPDTLINSWVEKTWLVDVATGEQTEVQTPVDSWQRLAP